ncbi:hypothetical protein NDU88_005704 [Pleurodeles waltl]|uniref:Uncharacterized protein n=1 Tax=Pleurodeles waltl TaxID=8319 RepID=A0AAV7PIW6_PLEWA|nr:hypothetical protein NDU88_005704 [Pleurodeles waltl]
MLSEGNAKERAAVLCQWQRLRRSKRIPLSRYLQNQWPPPRDFVEVGPIASTSAAYRCLKQTCSTNEAAHTLHRASNIVLATQEKTRALLRACIKAPRVPPHSMAHTSRNAADMKQLQSILLLESGAGGPPAGSDADLWRQHPTLTALDSRYRADGERHVEKELCMRDTRVRNDRMLVASLWRRAKPTPLISAQQVIIKRRQLLCHWMRGKPSPTFYCLRLNVTGHTISL